MKKIYLSGQINTDEKSIQNFAEELESRGHEVIEKWFLDSSLPKPYLGHPETSTPAAIAMINAAFDCDVFILFPSDGILGAAVELGAAIASARNKVEKIILVVNPSETRQSVFYAHSAVAVVKELSEIRQLSWY